jgi:hypothetical protein
LRQCGKFALGENDPVKLHRNQLPAIGSSGEWVGRDRLGAAVVAAGGEQFERAAAVGFGERGQDREAATCDAGSSSVSSPGFNGSAGSSFAGNTTPTISSALSSSPASLSFSNDFEIGSSHRPQSSDRGGIARSAPLGHSAAGHSLFAERDLSNIPQLLSRRRLDDRRPEGNIGCEGPPEFFGG